MNPSTQVELLSNFQKTQKPQNQQNFKTITPT